MSLNSNVLIPLGISVADRAAMLGHSVETNLKFYSYAQKGYIEDVRNRLNTGFSKPGTPRDTSGTPKIVDFPQNKKAQNHWSYNDSELSVAVRKMRLELTRANRPQDP